MPFFYNSCMACNLANHMLVETSVQVVANTTPQHILAWHMHTCDHNQKKGGSNITTAAL